MRLPHPKEFQTAIRGKRRRLGAFKGLCNLAKRRSPVLRGKTCDHGFGHAWRDQHLPADKPPQKVERRARIIEFRDSPDEACVNSAGK